MFRSIGSLVGDAMLGLGIEAAAVERATNEKRHGGAEGLTLHAVPVTPGEGGRNPAMGMGKEAEPEPRQVGREKEPTRPKARVVLRVIGGGHANNTGERRLKPRRDSPSRGLRSPLMLVWDADHD